MKLDYIFPIPIVRDTINDRIVQNTKKLVNNFIEEENFLNPLPPVGELLTTFYKSKDFLGSGIQDSLMLDEVNRKSREFLDLRGFDRECYIDITSWLQIYPYRSFFNRHDHYGALVSGAIYLDAPQNSGTLRFHNPLDGRRATDTFFHNILKDDNEYNYTYFEYTPIAGEIIMFEPWIQHSVEFNQSEQNRIAIGFNIWGCKNE